MNAEQRWFYMGADGARIGPLTIAEMDLAVERGAIVANTLVWRQGWQDWCRADGTTEVDLGATRSTPPPAPPPMAPREPAGFSDSAPASARPPSSSAASSNSSFSIGPVILGIVILYFAWRADPMLVRMATNGQVLWQFSDDFFGAAIGAFMMFGRTALVIFTIVAFLELLFGAFDDSDDAGGFLGLCTLALGPLGWWIGRAYANARVEADLPWVATTIFLFCVIPLGLYGIGQLFDSVGRCLRS